MVMSMSCKAWELALSGHASWISDTMLCIELCRYAFYAITNNMPYSELETSIWRPDIFCVLSPWSLSSITTSPLHWLLRRVFLLLFWLLGHVTGQKANQRPANNRSERRRAKTDVLELFLVWFSHVTV